MFRSLKMVFLFLLIPAMARAASLTSQQTGQAVSASLVLEKDAQNLFTFAYSVNNLVQNGYSFQLNYTTTPVQGTLTAQQQQDIVNYYQSLKQQLQSDFANLP